MVRRRAGDKDEPWRPSRRRPRRRRRTRSASQLRLLAGEGEAAAPADQGVQRRGRRGRRHARSFVEGINAVLRRRRDADRQGHLQAGRVVARLLAVGAAAELRGRPALHGRGGALDRAHAARDRDVGADGARARLPEARSSASPTCCGSRPPARAGPSSGGPSSATSSSSTPAPDFSTSGLSFVVAEYYAALGKKEGLTEKDIADAAGAQARARHRALDRPLRRHDAVHRRPAQEGGARATRARWRWRRSRCSTSTARAATATSSSRSIPRRARSTPTRRSSRSRRRGCRAAAGRGREGVPGVPGRRDHAGGRRQVGLPPRRPRDRAGGADHGRQRRRPQAARARARSCPSRACWPRSRRPGAATASPPTSCSCSTPRAR